MNEAASGQPMDFLDASGVLWIMAACGHRCGGGVKREEKIALCPNCRMIVALGGTVLVQYPERVPDGLARGADTL